MTQADLRTPRRGKIGVFVGVALLHVVAGLALVRAFAPEFTAATVDRVMQSFTVTITAPPPPPPPPQPEPTVSAQNEGAAAPAGRKAVPRETKVPVPKIPLAKTRAPAAASTGTADTSGAAATGTGTGAGGIGNGTGSGTAGNGQGGQVPRPLEKVAGDISSTRDFPRATRDRRQGTRVVVEMVVGTDGRARDCRVVTPGGDPEADATVCRLAEARFRFLPRLDSNGNPVVARYRWQQRWWNPGE